MAENLKDQMVETEDLLMDCIEQSMPFKLLPYCADIDEFIKEFQSRGKKVKLKAVFDLIGVKNFLEFKQYFYADHNPFKEDL
jgi:hypothetical protein